MSTYVVEVTLNHVHIAGQCLEIVVRLFRAQVARAEYVLNSIRYQNLLELGRQVVASKRYVEIAENEHQLVRTTGGLVRWRCQFEWKNCSIGCKVDRRKPTRVTREWK